MTRSPVPGLDVDPLSAAILRSLSSKVLRALLRDLQAAVEMSYDDDDDPTNLDKQECDNARRLIHAVEQYLALEV